MKTTSPSPLPSSKRMLFLVPDPKPENEGVSKEPKTQPPTVARPNFFYRAIAFLDMLFKESGPI